MTRRAWTLAALLVAGISLVVAVVPFFVRWSRPCEDERSAAASAWEDYANAADGAAETEARAVAQEIRHDLGAAVERAESLLAAPSDSDDEGARLYRNALERLSLAEGACADPDRPVTTRPSRPHSEFSDWRRRWWESRRSIASLAPRALAGRIRG